MPSEPSPSKFTLENVIEQAKETLLREGHHTPTILAEGDPFEFVITRLPENLTSKEGLRALFMAGYFIRQTGQLGLLEQVFLIFEAWITIKQDHQPPPAEPSQDSQAYEALVIAELAAESGQLTLVFLEMLRDMQGKVIDLSEIAAPEKNIGLSDGLFLTAFVEGVQAASPEAVNAHEGLFPLGQLVATPGAIEALNDTGQHPEAFVSRHLRGDWGDLDDEDKQANDRSVKEGSRILSAYHLNTGVKIWIITEWDRSVTTLLLPSEY